MFVGANSVVSEQRRISIIIRIVKVELANMKSNSPKFNYVSTCGASPKFSEEEETNRRADWVRALKTPRTKTRTGMAGSYVCQHQKFGVLVACVDVKREFADAFEVFDMLRQSTVRATTMSELPSEWEMELLIEQRRKGVSRAAAVPKFKWVLWCKGWFIMGR